MLYPRLCPASQSWQHGSHEIYVPKHEDAASINSQRQRALVQCPTHCRVILGELRTDDQKLLAALMGTSISHLPEEKPRKDKRYRRRPGGADKRENFPYRQISESA
jgi:hypothetical protein